LFAVFCAGGFRLQSAAAYGKRKNDGANAPYLRCLLAGELLSAETLIVLQKTHGGYLMNVRRRTHGSLFFRLLIKQFMCCLYRSHHLPATKKFWWVDRLFHREQKSNLKTTQRGKMKTRNLS
jgi:hypothetical protein